MKKLLPTIALVFALVASGNAWADTSVLVSGNTVDEGAGENGSAGWWFNRDTNNDTPIEFNSEAASIGAGSLEVLPIAANPADKLVAESFVWQPIAELESISYDFKIAGNGTQADADDFYVNVYANIDDSNNFYDCRFDYVASTGSTTGFTTASFDVTDDPTAVRQRGTRTICPATLAQMPEGSHVRMFSINVGDTSANDAGLGGHLDNVVVTTSAGATTYDFEPPLETKDQCKQGGYLAYGFANQGACISSLQANGNAGK